MESPNTIILVYTIVISITIPSIITNIKDLYTYNSIITKILASFIITINTVIILICTSVILKVVFNLIP